MKHDAVLKKKINSTKVEKQIEPDESRTETPFEESDEHQIQSNAYLQIRNLIFITEKSLKIISIFYIIILKVKFDNFKM